VYSWVKYIGILIVINILIIFFSSLC